MNNVGQRLTTVFAIGVLACGAVAAQVTADAPSNTNTRNPDSTSSNRILNPVPSKNAPRVLQTPQQQRDTADATAASALREERPVVPQLNIQLGRPAPTSAVLPTANGKTLRRNGVDENVAQCEAQADAQERVSCRERLARSGQAGVRRGN